MNISNAFKKLRRSFLRKFLLFARICVFLLFFAVFVTVNNSLALASFPNDSSYGSQWGIAKINAPQAWNATQSNAAIRIAILDTGIDLDHEDLAAKIVLSKDFVIVPPGTSAGPNDINGHGTHVAGTAAAITNNSLGVAGVGYNVSIMNGKVVDDTNFAMLSWVADGIVWAVDNGADVINISWSAGSGSATLENAINYAWDNGVVIVAGAGNSAGTSLSYPAAYPNVIAVAATNQDDTLWSSSRYGLWVDVAAPGVNIFSTHKNNGYTSGSGTSFASPHVAGLAALLMSVAQDTNCNGRVNDEVRAAIEGSAVDISALNPLKPLAHGRIDAAAAVAMLGGPCAGSAPAPSDTTAPSTVPGLVSSHAVSTWSTDSTIDVSWTAATDTGGSGVAGYSYLFDTSATTTPDTTSDGAGTTATSGAQSDGNSIYFHVRAVDSVSNWGTAIHLGPFYVDTTVPATPGTPSTTTPTSDTTPAWTWTASTDAGSGLHATTPYTVQWCTASDFTGCAANTATSTANSYTHSVALADNTWYFKAKAMDALSQESAYSSNGSAVIDATAPGAVSSLSLSNPSHAAITLSWTSQGDDGSIGTAASVDIRYATSSIAEANWSLAQQVLGEPAPLPAGSSQSMAVTGLLASTTYFFAMKASDEVSNVSALSNVSSLATAAAPESLPAPAPIPTSTTPAPTPIPTPIPTPTPTPISVPTPISTPTPTSTPPPTSISTPTITPAPVSTPTSTSTPAPAPTALHLVAIPAVPMNPTASQIQAAITAILNNINYLRAQLAELAALEQPRPNGVPAHCRGIVFSSVLKVGSMSNEVKCLQALLNQDPSTRVLSSGPGSSGYEIILFGFATKAAVVKFQEKYASEILAPSGLTAGTGILGPATRAKLNSLLGK